MLSKELDSFIDECGSLEGYHKDQRKSIFDQLLNLYHSYTTKGEDLIRLILKEYIQASGRTEKTFYPFILALPKEDLGKEGVDL